MQAFTNNRAKEWWNSNGSECLPNAGTFVTVHEFYEFTNFTNFLKFTNMYMRIEGHTSVHMYVQNFEFASLLTRVGIVSMFIVNKFAFLLAIVEWR